MQKHLDRKKGIQRIGIVGIITNILLVVAKATIGFLSGSISIVLDAFNNLSDVASSIITMVSIRLASKKPDKEHPYGHGRIEHFSSLSIAIIIFATGLSFLSESINRIFNPSFVSYTWLMLLIIFISIAVKIALGTFTSRKGNQYNSDSLKASGKDALFDALITGVTLIGAMSAFYLDINIDGVLGTLISLLIMRSGIEIIKESINEIISGNIDPKLSHKIKALINRHQKVKGSYDLQLHQYGPETILGSVKIEVEDDMTAREIHILTKEIEEEISKKHNVDLTIGIFATNTISQEIKEIKNHIATLTKNNPHILNFHGFYVDRSRKNISFDIVFDFEEKNTNKITEELIKSLKSTFKNYTFSIDVDCDHKEIL